jgi:hypothetical protein
MYYVGASYTFMDSSLPHTQHNNTKILVEERERERENPGEKKIFFEDHILFLKNQYREL